MRLLERLDGFLRLPVRHERLREETPKRGLLRVDRHEPRKEDERACCVIQLQIDDRERLQGVVVVHHCSRGAPERLARVGEPPLAHRDRGRHHPSVVQRGAIVAFRDLALIVPERLLRRGHFGLERGHGIGRLRLRDRGCGAEPQIHADHDQPQMHTDAHGWICGTSPQ